MQLVDFDMEQQTQIKFNPFPGLRPFGLDESHLFFGREGQSEIIINFLSKYRFAAITGSSGSGKSSLVYCGVVPLLYGGFVAKAGTKWRIMATRPGSTPVWNLANSIAEMDSQAQGQSISDSLINYYYSVLRRHSLGLRDAISQINLQQDENLLIIIDQFEELFRYSESRMSLKTHKDDPETLIRLLVETIRQTDIPVYIIITMRSDFIGELSDYQDFTNVFNQSNYLVPQMTRSDFEQVIQAPLRVVNTQIEEQLLQTLLNSLEHNHDQLPVLQHAMMRTWEFWKRNNASGGMVSLRDYIAAGRIDNALSMHANEAYNELEDDKKDLCKIIFKAITEKGKEGKGIRRPATIKEISELAQAQVADVIHVVEVFRKPGRSFLTPGPQVSLTAETTIDISHESLMRVWDKLRLWVDEEAASAQMYLRMVELSTMFQSGKTGLLKPPDLHLASNWKKAQSPNRAWAKRYDPAFEKAIVYLNTSEKRQLQEEETKVRIQKRTLYRTRRIAAVMTLFAIAFLVLGIYAYMQSQEAIKQKIRAESYASVMEGEKDTALSISRQKEIERLLAIQQRDSLERASLIQLIRQEEETEQAYQLIEEAQRRSQELEKTAEQIQQEKLLAEQRAQLAQQGISEAEVEKRLEMKKRMLVLSQTIALKATQVNDNQLSGLLAYQAYLLNQENGGQINHPEIFRGLFHSLKKLKGQEFNALRAHTSTITSMVYDPARNMLYSSDNAGIVYRWSFRRKVPTSSQIITNEDANSCIAITVDGRWIAVGSENRTIQLFNALQPNLQPRVFDAHNGKVKQVFFIPGKNAMVSLGSDDKVKYWDLLVNESSELFTDAVGINAIVVSPSGSTILCGTNNGKVYEWNINNEKERIVYNHNSSVMALAYDFESEKIAIGDRSGKIVIINSRGSVLKDLGGHSSRILALTFSPDNRMLASSGMDGVIRVWNSTDWNDLPIEIRDQESWAQSLLFSPDSKQLLSGSDNDNLIYIWPLKTQYLVDEICGYLHRQLTQQEWSMYIGSDVNYREVCK
jgi:WD40 repeat protein/energy-coupling factor transporter ATP-binding protein EcfA2